MFNDRIYWLVAALVLLICYFEFRFRWAAAEIPTIHTNKVSPAQYEEDKKRRTIDAVHELVTSPIYKEYIGKKSEIRVIDVDNEEEWDQDFVKDLADNEETIYSE